MEHNPVKEGMKMEEEKDLKVCYTCNYLRIKDFCYGICNKTNKIIDPYTNCEHWIEREEKNSF